MLSLSFAHLFGSWAKILQWGGTLNSTQWICEWCCDNQWWEMAPNDQSPNVCNKLTVWVSHSCTTSSFPKVLAVKTTVWTMWSPRRKTTSTRGLLETPVYMRPAAWIPETRLMTRGVWYGPISLLVLRDSSQILINFRKKTQNGLWPPLPCFGKQFFREIIACLRKFITKLPFIIVKICNAIFWIGNALPPQHPPPLGSFPKNHPNLGTQASLNWIREAI